MSQWELAETIEEIGYEVRQTSRAFLDALLSVGGLLPSPPSAAAPAQRERLRVTVWRMRQLLQNAVGEGTARDLSVALSLLSRRGSDIEKAVVVWIDLIEVLVQNTEQRYGSAPGRGRIKAAEVKQVVNYLLRSNRFGVPEAPGFLRTVLVETVVSAMIDAIALMANRYDLWEPTPLQPQTLSARLSLALRRLGLLLRPLWLPLDRLALRIWNAFQAGPVLRPELRAALQAIEREGMIAREGQVATSLTEALIWIGTHRASLVAGVELVFEAVQEAENFAGLTGPEKKAYARDLVLAVLEDLGLIENSGVLFAVISAVISGAIEGAVHLFNKRGVFQHGR